MDKLRLFGQCHSKLKIIIFLDVEFRDELLSWIALDFTGVPNKVTTGCKIQNSKTDEM